MTCVPSKNARFLFIPIWIARRLSKAHVISKDWSDCGCTGWSVFADCTRHCRFCPVPAHTYLLETWKFMKYAAYLEHWKNCWRLTAHKEHSMISIAHLEPSAQISLKHSWSNNVAKAFDLGLCCSLDIQIIFLSCAWNNSPSSPIEDWRP